MSAQKGKTHFRFYVYGIAVLGEKKGLKTYDIYAKNIKEAAKILDEDYGQTVWSAIDSKGKSYTDEDKGVD